MNLINFLSENKVGVSLKSVLFLSFLYRINVERRHQKTSKRFFFILNYLYASPEKVCITMQLFLRKQQIGMGLQNDKVINKI